MKAIWKGAISFGLVNIPVKLYSATQQSSLDLDMVDPRDMSHIRFKRINEDTGKEVSWENIAKAYWLNERYVLLEPEDFESAAPEKSKIIQVDHFVDETDIDTIYFENSYYVEPEKSGVKAYALMREALAKSKKVGIAQFVLRTTETLTVLKPRGNVLVLSKIRFAQEIRETSDLKLPAASEVKPTELKMAMALIKQYTTPFSIEKFKDEYAASLLKIIKAKAKGKKTSVPKLRIVHSKSKDLMEQLKASLEKSKQKAS
ncbi:MAG: Ku protein [Candidatus Fluviicola riflensis]|nr:MAG: Ku protein [Candidatus Fluviicola riflensis]OGS75850.1 MAG: Ku protein [Candidatus Fluviicola riflensis]OGS83530.1 MAG: Ku protein [Fluviicola sp. RIFCSPHIGHO2_01_FULL_43_53]OGS85669.1 MAG: Ku protein [Fluviicola sp. RIFCSPHIGHO2_12_FULL_43_24]